MFNKIKKGATNGVSFVFVLVTAIVSTALIIAWFTINTTQVFVATKNISAGTKLTNSLYSSGAIKQVEINKSFFNGNGYSEADAITDIQSVAGGYILKEMTPGQILYSSDIASTYNIRNNRYLTEYGYEAFTFKPEDFTLGNLTNLLSKGDKINIYGLYEFDLTPLKNIKQYEFANGSYDYSGGSSITTEGFTAADYEGIRVEELPTWLQEVCKNSGLEKEDYIFEDEIIIAQLMYQNVPIIAITKSTGSNAADAVISNFTIAVDSHTAEELYILLTEADLGATLLPFSDSPYVLIEDVGTSSFAIHEFGKVYEDQ